MKTKNYKLYKVPNGIGNSDKRGGVARQESNPQFITAYTLKR